MTDSLKAGRREVEISHADRVMFSDAGLTKLDLARHYADVADVMVPHVREHPLALHSYPQGAGGPGYFVKDRPKHFPDWVPTVAVPKREGGTIHQVMANDAATLVYLAGQNVITPHLLLARADQLERPDRLVFDLDPSTERFDEVRATARLLGDLAGEGAHLVEVGGAAQGRHDVQPPRPGGHRERRQAVLAQLLPHQRECQPGAIHRYLQLA